MVGRTLGDDDQEVVPIPSIFSLDFLVRDYECDIQGIVNNANYLHYLEHTRHRFLAAVGIDFRALHERGVDPVVVSATINFRRSLTSGDHFRVTLDLKRQGRLRLVFSQTIVHSDGRTIADAQIAVAVLAHGRPVEPQEFLSAVVAWQNEHGLDWQP